MIPAIFGIAGPDLTADEAAFLADSHPLGVILFRRNIETPDQVRRLTDAVRRALNVEGPCLWVDQEGGRVQRLGPPHWEPLPPARRIGETHDRSAEDGEYAAWLLGRIIADQAAGAGFDVACAPVLDLTIAGSHDVIGDRAFHADPEIVALLGRAMADGIHAGGVTPVSKHWPGHGRAWVDSHLELPVVETERVLLEATDFAPFRQAGDCAPIAMTAHILFSAIDPDRPATMSPLVIEGVIRGWCGFDGFLVSDDIDMKALNGRPGEIARAALAAGCDGVLQCSGDFAAMTEVADAVGGISPAALERWDRVARSVPEPDAAPVDRAQLMAELGEALG